MLWLLALALGASPNAAFEKAVCAGDVKAVEAQLKKDAGLLTSGNPTALAARCDRPEVLKTLLAAGADPGNRSGKYDGAVHQAAELAYEDHAIALVRLLPKQVEDERSDGMRPLAIASARAGAALVRELLALGAAVDAKNRGDGRAAPVSGKGLTALHFAAARGSPSTVEALLAAKATVDATDDDGVTPLMLAVSGAARKDEAIKRLVAAGADVNAVDRSGQSVALRAVMSGGLETLVLLGPGVDLVRPGASLVDWAVRWNNLPVLEHLLAHGISLEPTASWPGAVHSAVREDRGELLARLAGRMKTFDAPDPTHDGKTPLLVAAEKGSASLVKQLLALGANPASKDRAGRTARDLAEGQGNYEVLRLLPGNPADVDPAAQQFALIFGGGKQPTDAARWLSAWNAEASRLWKDQLVVTEGFPKVVASADIPGMNPGFNVVVLGYCTAAQLAPVIRLLKAGAERTYARKVTSAPQPGSCPSPSRAKTLRAFDVVSVGGDRRLHLAAFEDRAGTLEVLATVRDAQGALVETRTLQLHGGAVELARGRMVVEWSDPDAACGPPATGTTTIGWRDGLFIDEALGPSTWRPSCGE